MSFSLTPQDIYHQTNGGLDVILRYYPQAEPARENKKHAFKIREENTASARLSEYNGIYYVKDFGDSARAMNAIEVVMRERNLEFYDALRSIAEEFQIETDGKKIKKFEARYERRKANDDEVEGQCTFVETDFTIAVCKSIFSENVWRYLCEKNLGDSKKVTATDEHGFKEAVKVFKTYNLVNIQSYSLCAKDKKNGELIVHTYFSTADYPILMFDEGSWKKFYKPKERDPQFRFFSTGEKPQDYLFGINQVMDRYNEYQEKVKDDSDEADDDEDGGRSKKKEQKLPEAILVSGGSDAMNIAALGYLPVWLNSETAKLLGRHYNRIISYVERLYNLPDIDKTGKKEALRLSLEYLDMATIYLPEELMQKRDMRGKPCKDVKDYFRYYKPWDFKQLLQLSYPMKFWDEDVKRGNGGKMMKRKGKIVYEYKPNNELLYNFLYRMGFGLMEEPSEKDGQVMVQVDGHIVQKVKYSNINRYVKAFLREKVPNPSWDLLNAFHRSPHFSEKSLSNLPFLHLEFEDTGRDFQYFFFSNEVWKVTAENIETMKPANCDRFAWEDEVIGQQVKLLERPFNIFVNPKTGKWDITIYNNDCLFLRFAINTSRVYWRAELEDRLDEKTKEFGLDFRKDYLEKYRFAIDGPLLTDEEIQEQKQHLIAKLVSYGYLHHRFKDAASTYCVWGMDYHIANSEDSNGGTGKSIFYYAGLQDTIKSEYFDGRNDKLTSNPHIYEGVTEHTDYLYIDDADKYFNFDFFFPIVTGPLKANPKGSASYTIPFRKSPKMCITSNFPPRKNDKTTRRRLWFTAFADYYHKNPNGEYREERLPIKEFGKTLFSEFTPEEWNMYHNTAAYCTMEWMKHGQVEPPMETLMKNQYKNAMGETFHAWADAYFSEAANRLDNMVPRYMAFETFKRQHMAQISAQGFMEKLRNWCFYHGYKLDPESAVNSKDGRIVKWTFKFELNRGQWEKTDKKESIQMIYVQTDESKAIRAELEGESDLPF